MAKRVNKFGNLTRPFFSSHLSSLDSWVECRVCRCMEWKSNFNWITPLSTSLLLAGILLSSWWARSIASLWGRSLFKFRHSRWALPRWVDTTRRRRARINCSTIIWFYSSTWCDVNLISSCWADTSGRSRDAVISLELWSENWITKKQYSSYKNNAWSVESRTSELSPVVWTVTSRLLN